MGVGVFVSAEHMGGMLPDGTRLGVETEFIGAWWRGGGVSVRPVRWMGLQFQHYCCGHRAGLIASDIDEEAGVCRGAGLA
jgi:hypothetical protein